MDDVSMYEVEIDLANPNTSHAQVVDLVGRNKRVIDIGCWTGDLGRVLKTRGCVVSGIELDPAAAEKARADLHPVIVSDLNTSLASEHFEAGSFDVVVFADVLEHVMDPVQVLRDAATLLAPGGRVVISVPNITHGSVRLALLQGRWRYTDTGLLDATHLKFYSREGLLDLFEKAGLQVTDLRATLADPLEVEVQVEDDRLPRGVVEWVRHQPDALVYQFMAAAQTDAASADAAVMVAAVAEEDARASDRHTRQFEEDLDARHRRLTMRDHIIGLEAATATAQSRADRAEAQLGGALRRLERKNDRIKELVEQVAELKNGPGKPDGPIAQETGGLRSSLGRLRPRNEQ